MKQALRILIGLIAFSLVFVSISVLGQQLYWYPMDQRIRMAVDYNNPVVRSFAVRAINPRHSGEYNIGQICDVWEKIYNNWVYVSDPPNSTFDFTPASHTIAYYNFRGDCDDFAVLVAACIVAIGGTARVVVEYNVHTGKAHAYALVYLGDQENARRLSDYIYSRYPQAKTGLVWCMVDSSGWWLNLDWTARYPGGPFWVPDRQNVVVLARVDVGL